MSTKKDDFDAKNELYKSVAKENGFRHSIWSIYAVTDFAQIPFPNATKLMYEYYDSDDPLEIPLSRNSSYLDLWKAAEIAIQKSKDEHHIFIENFVEDGEVLILETGS